MFCREQVAQLRGRRAEIEALGAALLFVGSGAPRFARDFQRTFAPGSPVYSDPSGATYDALGARRGVLTTLGPSALRAGVRAMRGGFRQGRTRGLALVQGGVVVTLPGGRVAWSHLSRHAGDHPGPSEVVTALRRAVATA